MLVIFITLHKIKDFKDNPIWPLKGNPMSPHSKVILKYVENFNKRALANSETNVDFLTILTKCRANLSPPTPPNPLLPTWWTKSNQTMRCAKSLSREANVTEEIAKDPTNILIKMIYNFESSTIFKMVQTTTIP